MTQVQVTVHDFILLAGAGVSTETSVGTSFNYSDDPAMSDLVAVLDDIVFSVSEGAATGSVPLGSTTTINGVNYTFTEAYDFWGGFTKTDPQTGEQFIQNGQTLGFTFTAQDGSTLSVLVPSDTFNPSDPWVPGAIESIAVLSAPTPEPFGIVSTLSGDSKLGNDDDVFIPCFTTGTLIDTDEGRKPVEALMPGDRVMTRDCGYQAVRWVGQRKVTERDLRDRPEFAAVIVRAGALGDGLPERDTRVSPWHRLLLTGQRAELMFGEREVLVPAIHLVGRAGFERDQTATTYVHVMFDEHQIIRGDGAWSESFQPGAKSLDGMDLAQRTELYALFPELAKDEGRAQYVSARITISKPELDAMLAA